MRQAEKKASGPAGSNSPRPPLRRRFFFCQGARHPCRAGSRLAIAHR